MTAVYCQNHTNTYIHWEDKNAEILHAKYDGTYTKYDGTDTKYDCTDTKYDGTDTKYDGTYTKYDGSTLNMTVRTLTTAVCRIKQVTYIRLSFTLS